MPAVSLAREKDQLLPKKTKISEAPVWGSVEYSFIAFTPKSTLTLSDNAC